jgi:hypothetical protein
VDKDYFTNYCGYGSYDENYLFHSGIEHCISILRRHHIPVVSVLVLGAATGKVLTHFDEAFGVRAYGCEITPWAHRQIPARYRRRIRCADMRRYVPGLVQRRQTFDVLFSNALVYLQEKEIPCFVDLCSRICGRLHFWSSTCEDYEEGDRYRVTLRPRDWWAETFRAGGFSRTRSPYLWRSNQRGVF